MPMAAGDAMQRAGIAQLVEREPSKLGVAGSSPVSRSNSSPFQPGMPRAAQGWFGNLEQRLDKANAHVAQSVEHFLGKEEVMGSNPVVGFQEFAPGRPAWDAK